MPRKPIDPAEVLEQDRPISEVLEAMAPQQAVAKQLKFRSRITVTDAYQYDGKTWLAPPFVDTNWLTVNEGKPCLELVDHEKHTPVWRCNIGDWIVRQDIVRDDGTVENGKVTCMSDDEFRKYFIHD